MHFFKLTFCSLFSLFCTLSAFAQNIDSTSSDSATAHRSPLTSVPYTSVHYRGSVTININAQPQACQFNIVSVIDSFLYVQLNIGALEAGRALATPDNILFVNKLQKNYYDGDYSVFEKILDLELDFYTLQSIFNGIPTDEADELELSYQMDSLSYQYPFFSLFVCEYYILSVKLEVKKVAFNAVPDVSAVIPKNFTAIEIQ